jgi:hypothetical protein
VLKSTCEQDCVEMTPIVKLEIFVPESHLDIVRDALVALGVGRIGNYDACNNVSYVTGSWCAGPGSKPFQGKVGQTETSVECRLEMNCSTDLVSDAIKAINSVHPYETPPINIIPLANHQY